MEKEISKFLIAIGTLISGNEFFLSSLRQSNLMLKELKDTSSNEELVKGYSPVYDATNITIGYQKNLLQQAQKMFREFLININKHQDNGLVFYFEDILNQSLEKKNISQEERDGMTYCLTEIRKYLDGMDVH